MTLGAYGEQAPMPGSIGQETADKIASRGKILQNLLA